MDTKKNTKQIKDYYAIDQVVHNYDTRRFNGHGGKYINDTEVKNPLKSIKKIAGKDQKILDLGAGRGRLSLPLKSQKYEVYPLDSSKAMLQILSKKIDKKNMILGSVFDKVTLPTKFDVITSLRFFDHFNIEDQKKILKNFLPALEKNGHVVFTALNKNSIESQISSLFPYGRYNYFYTPAEYEKLFSELNLEVVDVKSYFFFPRGAFLYFQKIPLITPPLILLDKLLSAIFSKRGAFIVYTLKK